MPNWVHRLLLSLIFSFAGWFVIKTAIMEMKVWQYFLIEIIILIMVTLLNFVYKVTGISKESEE